MNQILKFSFIFNLLLQGCGAKPQGSVLECQGAMGFKEESVTTNSESTLLGLEKIGQHFGLDSDLNLESILIKAEIPGSTAAFFQISFYKLGLNDDLTDLTVPDKQMFVGPVSPTSGKEFITLKLPETYELKGGFESNYFVSVAISNATLKYNVGQMTSSGQFRKGFRSYSGGFWSFGDSSKSLGFGLSGKSGCQ